MAIFLDQFDLRPEESFYIGVLQDNLEKYELHYHQEYEISFITEGTGKRIVGDSIEEFHPGDLIFIGSKLPHVWIPEKYRVEFASGRNFESVYLLFNKQILDQALMELPEFSNVQNALLLSERGIKITGDTLIEVSELMLQLPFMDTFTRLITFYKIMNIIGESSSLSILASEEYMKAKFKPNNDRINTIHEYLMANFMKKINLEEISELVYLAPTSLCRFFKQHTNISLFEYLNKIKVDYASQLLMNKNLSVLEVSLDCGFNNLSHFNKQFKKFKGITPSQYRS
ncbi:MAG: AraC family transcriptional regulator [Bacteroidota bacterium]